MQVGTVSRWCTALRATEAVAGALIAQPRRLDFTSLLELEGAPAPTPGKSGPLSSDGHLV